MKVRGWEEGDEGGFVRVWNAVFEGKHAHIPLDEETFGRFILSKEIFEPEGLMLATVGDEVVGFVHCGFGGSQSDDGLDEGRGVISLVGVHPDWRRQGVGTTLVSKARAWLRERGAGRIHAISMWPLVPFYLGLYGGSEVSGVPEKDAGEQAFLRSLGFRPFMRSIILRRRLGESDLDVPGLRGGLELWVGAPLERRWYARQALHGLGCVSVRLIWKGSRDIASRCEYWLMDGFYQSTGRRTAGVISVGTPEEHRGKGLATLLMRELFRILRREGVELVELQTTEDNAPARRLYEKVGFEFVDRVADFVLAE